jgi:RNA polymerase sigma-70 factor (ECF subfamily)
MADAHTLFAQYQERLLRYFSRAVGEREVARDLAQEVFLRVSRANAPAAPDDQVAGWIFRIARNVALDHHRYRRRRPEAAVQSLERAQGAQQELAVALTQALATLSELDRDIFLLREVGGLTRSEIATACNLTTDAVRSRKHRARLELRDALVAPLRTARCEQIRPAGKL